VRIEELELVCQEAARNLVQQGGRPVPASVVLPLPEKTKVTALEGWPDHDDDRAALLERFATDVMRPANAPCYGFVAEAVAAGDGDQPVDVVVIVYGARRNHPRISAAPLFGEELGEFTPPEPLEPIAMPFMAALQRAADDATAPDALSG
jgi:hypothetical protein